MEIVLSVLLLAVIVFLVVFAFYLLLRIAKVYRRARRLETMRNYETILYASLRLLPPEHALENLIPDPEPAALEEVLLRMGDEGAEGWKDKVIALYDISGFTTRRMRQLHSRFKSRRSDAARRLGRICDPKAVPELKKLLADPKEEVREAALFALGRIGTREALEAMLDALNEGDRWSQEKVAEAVEEAGDDSRRVLVGLLRDENPSRRAFAAEVMGGIGGSEEAVFLEEALRDEEVDVRARAADSLGRMRHRLSRPALLEALEDPAWEVRAQAVTALGRIGEEKDAPEIMRAMRDKEWWVRSNAAAALREMGEAGEGPLIQALWDEDHFAREVAAQALEESSVVERVVDRMRAGEADPEGERTIHRLAEIGSRGTIIQVISDLTDAEAKARLVELLSDIDDPELGKVLKMAARDVERSALQAAEEGTGGEEGDESASAEDEENGR